jgi:hypothetical protein
MRVLLLLLLCTIQEISGSISTALRKDTVPVINDDFTNAADMLEFANICQFLHNATTKNIKGLTPTMYSLVSFVDTGDTKYWIGYSSDKLILAIRGSDGFADFVVDTNSSFTDLGPTGRVFKEEMFFVNGTMQVERVPVQVHSGFNQIFDHYDNIEMLLSPYLSEPDAYTHGKTAFDTLYVIGHSLGGAQASLLATYFSFQNPAIAVRATTFGQPRAGNRGFKIFSESIPNLNLWRVVNLDDVVPRLPFAGYHHAGHLLWRRDINKTTVAYEAYFRTIGNRMLGLGGIDDFSVAGKYKSRFWL